MAMPTIGSMPSLDPTANPSRSPATTDVMLKKPEDRAGIPNLPCELSTPIALAASAMNRRNGIITRVSSTVSSNFPAISAYPRNMKFTNVGAKTVPRTQIAIKTGTSRVVRRLESAVSLLLAFGREGLGVGGDERSRHRAFREEIAQQVRDAVRGDERVVLHARAEQSGEDHLSDQPGNPAERNRQARNARLAHYLGVGGIRVGHSTQMQTQMAPLDGHSGDVRPAIGQHITPRDDDATLDCGQLHDRTGRKIGKDARVLVLDEDPCGKVPDVTVCSARRQEQRVAGLAGPARAECRA